MRGDDHRDTHFLKTLEELHDVTGERVIEIGHLEGWGRGRGGDFGFGALETHGTDGQRWVRLVVRGAGALDVEVYSPRTGRTSLRIPVAG